MGNQKLAAVLLAGSLLLLSGCQEKPAGRLHRIEMKALGFEPAELAVASGDTVVWVNHDIVPHTATADARQFDSGSVAPGGEWSHVMRDPGRISYLCIFHPPMKGVLVVK